MFQRAQVDPFPDLTGPFTREELIQRLGTHSHLTLIGEPMDIEPGRSFLINVLDKKTHDVWGIIYTPAEEAGRFIRADWLPAKRP